MLILQDLVTLVQCRQVQFNSDPEVKHIGGQVLAEEGPQQAATTRPQKMTVGGLGPLYDFAASFGIEVLEEEEAEEEEVVEAEDDGSDEVAEVDSQVQTKSGDDSCSPSPRPVPNIRLQPASASSPGAPLTPEGTPPTPPVVSCHLTQQQQRAGSIPDTLGEAPLSSDSTFVLQEGESSSVANSTYTLEDEVFDNDNDDEDVPTSPKVTWRPATPPKKRRNSSFVVAEKENAAAAVIVAAAASSPAKVVSTTFGPSPAKVARAFATVEAAVEKKAPLGQRNRTSFFKSPLVDDELD